MLLKVLLFLILGSASPLQPGGDFTSLDNSKNAFSHPPLGIDKNIKNQFFVGNSFFKQSWVEAPSSTEGRDGLGPTYNAIACASCHVLDGRGPAYLGDKLGVSLLFRLQKARQPHPHYGSQLNPLAIDSVPAEAKVKHEFIKVKESYPDGTEVVLRKPVFKFTEVAFGSLEDTVISPRVGMQLIGLGLIEAISDGDILSQEDVFDRNRDGVSGRAQWVWDKTRLMPKLGRFGWKAEQPSVLQQVAAAFLGDIGITSSLFPDPNCPLVQTACVDAINGGSPELDDKILDRVTTYSRYLSVPASRFQDIQEYELGLQKFTHVGCAQCHRPSYTTVESGDFSQQVIYPFSDFLMHDMGEGLSDFVFHEGLASNELPMEEDAVMAQEWRTPPLWGIGLIPVVNNHNQLLHDGRARGVEEAILWHGGEAQSAKEKFKNLTFRERAQIIEFVEKL